MPDSSTQDVKDSLRGQPGDGAPGQDRATACSAYVAGYVPVAIDNEVRGCLNEFRRNHLVVDLRIERAMVSAATQICMDEPSMREQLMTSARDVLKETPPQKLTELTGRSRTSAVLIRRQVKKDVRKLAWAWGLNGADETINNVMVSAAISLVLAAESLHGRWVQLIADVVGKEVEEGFQGRKSKSG